LSYGDKEIQFNLAPYFDVLGEDGYRLHQELCSRNAEQSKRAEAFVVSVLQQRSHGGCLVGSDVTTDDTLPALVHTRDDCKHSTANGSHIVLSQCSQSDWGNGKSQQEVGEARPTEAALADLCSDPASSPSQVVSDDSEFLFGILAHGCQAAAVNPRDIPSLVCVHGLLFHLLESDHCRLLSQLQGSQVDKDTILAHASKCIIRCLAINSQAASLGMTGWLEYGSSAPFNRSVKLPFDLMYDLAACHAYGGRWEGAVEAVQASVAWCEEHEDPCHPRALVALLDLSSSLWNLGLLDLSTGILSLFYRRCSSHLATLEAACLERLNDQVLDGWKVIPTFRMENGPSPFSTLLSFCQALHDLLRRRFASILGPGYPAMAHHRSVLGDSYSVLANCASAADSLHGNDPESRSDALGYWRRALDQYSAVFYREDWSRTTPAAEASWYSMTHRMARCLYELGSRDEALEILTTALSEDITASPSSPSVSGPSDGTESTIHEISFVPSANQPPNHPRLAEMCLARASCHWLAAVLSAEVSDPPGRLEGWTRALSCLRSASHWYQSALQWLAPDAWASRAECLKQLETVEEEARRLLALRDGPLSSPAHHHRDRSGALLPSRQRMPMPPPPAMAAFSNSHGSDASAS
jgi:tetratricopeptide (TPR) repeat protein